MAKTPKTASTAAKAAAKSAKPAKKATVNKPAAPQAAAHVAREHLSIPDPKHVGLTTYDAKDPDTKYPPITTLRPPEGAPNVLIVLIDDVGFGAASAFGGPCNTPGRAVGGERAETQPLSHHRSVFPYPTGIADGT